MKKMSINVPTVPASGPCAGALFGAIVRLHRGDTGKVAAITCRKPIPRGDLDALLLQHAGRLRAAQFGQRVTLANRWHVWAVLATDAWTRQHSRCPRAPHGEPVVPALLAPYVTSARPVP